MKSLIFSLKKKLKYRLDLSKLSNCNYKNLQEVKKFKLNYGKNIINASELFSISGNVSSNIIIKSSSELLDNVGKDFQGESITIYGNVGNNLGQEMKSGCITVHGNTLDYTASGIKGGAIHIMGNVGDYFCAKPNHANEGMKNGIIYIRGNCGDFSLQRMRRGMVIINGDVGKNFCSEMISGTILINGKIGNDFGKKIKRGTFILRKKELTKDYIRSNNCNYNFFPFLKKNVCSITKNERIMSYKYFERYSSNKDESNLSEIFLLH